MNFQQVRTPINHRELEDSILVTHISVASIITGWSDQENWSVARTNCLVAGLNWRDDAERESEGNRHAILLPKREENSHVECLFHAPHVALMGGDEELMVSQTSLRHPV